MTACDHPRNFLSAIQSADVDFDTLYGALADADRRFILSCLDDHPGSLTLRDLASRLAIREHDVPITEIPDDTFEPTYLQLYHNHIPKLVSAGIVDYDPDRDTVVVSKQGDEARIAVVLANMGQRTT